MLDEICKDMRLDWPGHRPRTIRNFSEALESTLKQP
jgi:hypothetical protein